MTSLTLLGIDIAKAKFDIFLLNDSFQMEAQFDNTKQGFARLKRWLVRHRVRQVHACLEATGRYGEDLTHFLYGQGYQVSVVNPARIKKYADSQLRRNKTDKLDARIITDFCRTQEPALWSPPDPVRLELRELIRLRAALIKMRQQERNRLKSGVKSTLVRDSLAEHIAFLESQIAETEHQITTLIRSDADLKHDFDLLCSIPGINILTASVLLGEILDFSAFNNVRQLVAFAGLNPSHHQSGAFQGKSHLSKMGCPLIRQALYWPAISAGRHNPLIQPLYQRIKDQGRPTLVAIGASMRKLLHLAYGVLKSGRPFDPSYLAVSSLP